MKKCIHLRLSKGLGGWILVPCYARYSPEQRELLSLLYAQNWQEMPSADRFLCKDEPLEAVKKHIREVCKDLKLGVSFCGHREMPVLRLWRPEPAPWIEPIKLQVDLKWSLWSEDRGYWEEFAPGTWAQMEAAFLGSGPPVVVHTAPRKEIRYGSVTIAKGKAFGHFCHEWDELPELADTLGAVCNEAFNETIPFSSHLMEPGTDWEFGEIGKSIRARTFLQLMRKIDQEEARAISHNKQEWESIERLFGPRNE